MIEAIQIVTTTAEKSDAQRIAKRLLEQRLAACVQISGPIESSYWWKQQIETSQEWLCTIKTVRSLYERVEQAVRELHPYEEPEILATQPAAGSRGYLHWLADAAAPDQESRDAAREEE
jgi:periplasmic divalent cation tolerance protein